jgi:hypothetical protein
MHDTREPTVKMKVHGSVVRRIIQFVVGVIIAWPMGALAEWEYRSPINLFLDHSYLVFSPNRIKVNGDPHSPAYLIFEAQIAPNLYFPQWHTGDDNTQHVVSAVVTPLIRLRMLSEPSSPVIPPSYMPKLTLQYLFLKRWNVENEPVRFHNIGIGTNLILGHYSNGQTGCFFANQTGTDPNCVPAQGQLPLNEVSGSFSTNYIRGELHGQFGFDVDQDRRSAWVIGGSIALEVNTALGPGGISDDQRRVYGRGHIGLETTLERYWSGSREPREPGNLGRLSVALSIPYGEAPTQEPTVSVEAAYIPLWFLNGFGGFVRYVNGQDYYNMLFLEHVSLFQFGVTFELGPGLCAPPLDFYCAPKTGQKM